MSTKKKNKSYRKGDSTKRLESILVKGINAFRAVPNWFPLTVFRLVREAAGSLETRIEDPLNTNCTWDGNPIVEHRIPVKFDFENWCRSGLRVAPDDIKARSSSFDAFCDQIVLRVLTKLVAKVVGADGDVDHLVSHIDHLNKITYEEKVELTRRHFFVGHPLGLDLEGWYLSPGFLFGDYCDKLAQELALDDPSRPRLFLRLYRDVLAERLNGLNDKLIEALKFERPVPGFIRVQFMPRLLDESAGLAYYRIYAGMVFEREPPSDQKNWPLPERRAFWASIKRNLAEVEATLLEGDGLNDAETFKVQARVLDEHRPDFERLLQSRADQMVRSIDERGAIKRPGPRSKYSRKQIKAVLQAKQNGSSSRDIADDMGLTVHQVNGIFRRNRQ